ncbi:hypothetical protein [Zavarzinella formosa]|uniref:hypothetical protein n=1 Tax=Zavarzinella formosa TaxID=360055 RepID=UPI0003060E1F|nr:hypothetical protein [Zavarzinella formosa]
MFDPDELPAPPTLTPEQYDRLRDLAKTKGAKAAVEQLGNDLEELGDVDALFYSMLMKKRVELGVSPFPSGPSSDLPKEAHEEYENTIREAGRAVGTKLLQKHDVRRAFFYFNMLGETGPVKEYLDSYVPADADDIQGVIEVALYQGVHPKKGFELVVERYGVCNAITTYGGQDFSRNPEGKQFAIQSLVRTLHAQLLERLKADLEARGTPLTGSETIAYIVKEHPELMADGGYHIDTSHLSSIAQYSLELDACPERKQAIELCQYGEHLGEGLRYPSDPPFENSYADYRILLQVLEGIDAIAGLKHFEDKIAPGLAEGNTFPTEVYVNLLIRLGRKEEALELAKKHLGAERRQLSCPGVYELCFQAKDYAGLAEAARNRGDSVAFLASVIAAETR